MALDGGSAPTKPEVGAATTDADGLPQLRLATKCATVDDFVSQFHPFIDEASAFVPGRRLAAGTVCRLLITLKNGTAVLNARCEVRDSALLPPRAPAGATRLALLEVDRETKDVHRKLLARRRQRSADEKRPAPAPKPLRPVNARPLAPATLRAPDEAAAGAPRPEPRRPVVTLVRPVAKPTAPPAASDAETGETRAPGSSYKLPANPFSELSADALASFVDCTLFEEHERSPTGEAAAVLPASVVAPPANEPAAEAIEPAEPTAPPEPAAVRAPTPVPPAAPTPRWRRGLVKIAPLFASSALSLAAGYALRGGSPAAAPPAVVAPVVPAAAPTPVPVPPPEPAPPLAKPEPAPRSKGTLRVTSTPSGAALTLDGKWKIGTTPRTIEVALDERVVLEARRRGYRPWSQTVELTQPETEIAVRLEPAKSRKRAGKHTAAAVDFVDGLSAKR